MITPEWCVGIVLLFTIIAWYLQTYAEHFNTSPRPQEDKDNHQEGYSNTSSELSELSASPDQDKAGGNTERLNL